MNKDGLMKRQEAYLEKMVKHLPVLRASIKITQRELAKKLGVSRQSIMNIETRRSPLQWATYLALVFVFLKFEDSRVLVDSLGLFDDQFFE